MSSLINLVVALPDGRIAVALNTPTLNVQEAEQLVTELNLKITGARAAAKASELIKPSRRISRDFPR